MIWGLEWLGWLARGVQLELGIGASADYGGTAWIQGVTTRLVVDKQMSQSIGELATKIDF